MIILNQDKSKYIPVQSGRDCNAIPMDNKGYEFFVYIQDGNVVRSETLGYYKSIERIKEIIDEINKYEFFVYEMPKE